jgi:hypothetical protein
VASEVIFDHPYDDGDECASSSCPLPKQDILIWVEFVARHVLDVFGTEGA